MSDKILKTIKLKKNDHYRALLSDTTPFELPIIFNNDGFYSNVSNLSRFSEPAIKIIDKFIMPLSKGKHATVPFVFKVVKDDTSVRRLSLPHPRAQIDVCNFYKSHSNLIMHYCDAGGFSMRRPGREASRYYIANPNENKSRHKSNEVVTLDVDLLEKNPSSYFAYKGFSRLYKFFQSNLYNYMERNYKLFASFDVARCFDSIYTHSIAWSTKSKEEAKLSTDAHTFGSTFDRLMQSMNYNETNGIIVGPEVSRIFAEVILNKIDKNLQNRLNIKNIIFGVDYSCLRYVDNYYVFCNKNTTLDIISAELQDCLDFYKLHLNKAKTEVVTRPFFTKKSMAIYEADQLIKTIFDNIIAIVADDEGSYSVPRRIYKVSGLVRKFTGDLRRSCHLAGVNYDACAGYILAALKNRLNDIVDACRDDKKHPAPDEVENYSRFITFSLEVAFHLFSLHPNASSSLSLSHIIIRSGDFLCKHDKSHFRLIRERIQHWMKQLCASASIAEIAGRDHVTHVELLNLLIALRSFKFDGEFYNEVLNSLGQISNNTNYFEIITKIFIFGSDQAHKTIVNELFFKAKKFIIESPNLSEDSEKLHLLFDLMSCPYIDVDHRIGLVKDTLISYNKYQEKFSKNNTIVNQINADIRVVIDDFEKFPWFVSWDSVNLLRLIEKKELKRVYA